MAVTMSMKTLASATASIAILLVTTAEARAQWAVANLNPAGSTGSQAFGAAGGLQVGYSTVGGLTSASLWSGTPGSHVALHPSGVSGLTSTTAVCVGDGQQGGYAFFSVGSVRNACVWSGTPASFVNLNPAASTRSEVYGVGGGKQVGYATLSGVSRASLWSGNATSRIDLHPANASSSLATAVNATAQGGRAQIGGQSHAGIWGGTASSWTDLHPGAASSSGINAMSSDSQAGFATVGGVRSASLWRNTSASWVNLSPSGATSSEVFGAIEGLQVGTAFIGGRNRAGLWRSTSSSWLDLSGVLSADFTQSVAQGVSTDGSTIFISGYGFNSTANRYEALLWTQPVPGPGAPALLGLGAFLASRRRRRSGGRD